MRSPNRKRGRRGAEARAQRQGRTQGTTTRRTFCFWMPSSKRAKASIWTRTDPRRQSLRCGRPLRCSPWRMPERNARGEVTGRTGTSRFLSATWTAPALFCLSKMTTGPRTRSCTAFLLPPETAMPRTVQGRRRRTLAHRGSNTAMMISASRSIWDLCKRSPCRRIGSGSTQRSQEPLRTSPWGPSPSLPMGQTLATAPRQATSTRFLSSTPTNRWTCTAPRVTRPSATGECVSTSGRPWPGTTRRTRTRLRLPSPTRLSMAARTQSSSTSSRPEGRRSRCIQRACVPPARAWRAQAAASHPAMLRGTVRLRRRRRRVKISGTICRATTVMMGVWMTALGTSMSGPRHRTTRCLITCNTLRQSPRSS
mmetsp:Transcript_12373/g.29399  ORF Transcript_12373/g.29399 Transcript_12373/m.29399 type:complete len:367 (-) Transcript_12373:825-1925(-)